MSTTTKRRRTRTGAPARAVPRPVPPVPAPAEPPVPPAETPPAAPSEVELAEQEARLAEIAREAEFKARKAELALAALTDKAALAAAQRQRDAELAAALTEADVAEIRENAAARKWQGIGKRWRKRALTSSLRLRRLAVNLGVTGAAVFGQWEYLDDKTKIGTEGALLVSVLVELLAVSVLDYAHRRRKERRASWHLYLIAASMAGAVGTMNYLHWNEGDLALVGAVFALFSIAGPIMWSLSAVEAEVSADGEQGAARRSAQFPAEQWALFFPSTFAAKRIAVRHGILDPVEALDLLAERKAERAARRGRSGTPAAAGEQSAEQPVEVPVVEQPAPPVDPPVEQPAPPYALEGVPTADQLAAMAPREIQAAARATARKAIAAGARPTGKELGDAYGLSDRWGRARLDEVDKITSAA